MPFINRVLPSPQMHYPEAIRLLLYRGADRLVRDGVLCLPVAEFLQSLKPDRLTESASLVPPLQK